MPSSLENPPALSREQFHRMLTEALAADPNLARRVFKPLAGTVFPIQGGNPGTFLTVQDDGKVGIGTATPGFALDIDPSGVAGRFLFDKNSEAVSQYRAESTANCPDLYQQKARGSKAAPTVVQSGDRLANIIATGYDGSNYIEAARVTAEVDGSPSSNDMPGRLTFGTRPSGGAAPVERMRIDSAGSVILGATATKQTTQSGGPELISAQGADQDKVVLWCGLTGDTNARFLFSYRGFLEWGPGTGTPNDQDVALFRNGPAGISIQNFTNTKATRAFSVNAAYDRSLQLQNEEYPLFVVNTEDRSMRLAPGIVAASGVKTFAGSDYVITRGEKTTTDATAQTLATIALSDTRAYYFVVRVVARQSGGSNHAFFHKEVLYRREGSGPFQVGIQDLAGSPSSGAFVPTGWSIAFNTSGNNVLVQVTGPAATTIYWVATVEYQSVSTDA
ncbi:MAG: hypothetical protein A3J28_03545 [Acidobacteria bacterium RIFCSPLOWO2_12_FULL_60_22]|nr:MAG: hypothetical protein A3J28_03545 [Acidobacteria bacterium RIFCSPLOWO2_12_FULL_60_22]